MVMPVFEPVKSVGPTPHHDFIHHPYPLRLEPRSVYLCVEVSCPASRMDGPKFRALALDHGRVHKLLGSSTEERHAEKVCEIIKAALREKAIELVKNAGGRPILFSYGSDGTPLLTRATLTQSVGTQRVVRSGGKAEEVLVERGFVKAFSPCGDPRVVALTRDPVPLSNGKSAAHMVTPLSKFFPVIQSLGHEGLVVYHYVFDRAVCSSLGRMALQRLALWQEAQPAGSGGLGGAVVSKLKCWQVVTACANHDAQNGLRWSLKAISADEDIPKRLHVVIASLRHSFDLLHGELDRFVVKRLRFVPDDPIGHQHRYSYWVALGADSDAAEMLADLALWWSDGALEVSDRHAASPELFQRVSLLMWTLCRFKDFTDSRWATMGPSCRTLIALLSLGLKALVQDVLGDPSKSQYHLSGFSQLNHEVEHYAAVCAISSVVCDSVLYELLEDDRMAKRVSIVEEAIHTEVEWASALDDSVWHRLGRVIGIGAQSLRTDCLSAAGTMRAFMEMRFLFQARQLPWSLALGNISENLDNLLRTKEVVDPTSQKIVQLLSMGFPRPAIEEAVSLLADCPWTTTTQEQGHRAASGMHQAHRLYGTRTLTTRSLINTVRPLFLPAPKDAQESRLLKEQAALQKRQPDKVSGRQLFFRDMVKTARGQQGGSDLGPGALKSLMQYHNKLYNKLDQQEKNKYEVMARGDRRRKQEDLVDEKEALAVSLNLRRTRLAEERFEQVGRLRMANCRFSDEDCEKMARSWDSAAFAKKEVDALRVAAITPPSALPDAVLDRMELHPVEPLFRWPRQNPCFDDVARRREFFHHCLLVAHTETDYVGYLFLFGLMNPLVTAFLVAHPDPEEDVQVPRDEDTLEDLSKMQGYDHRFTIDWSKPVFGKDIVISSDQSLSVLPNMVVSGKNTVASNDVLIPFAEFFAALPEVARAKSEARDVPRRRTGTAPPPQAPYPWMRRYLPPDGAEPGSRSTGEERERAGVEELDDDAIEAAFSELERKRREIALVSTPEDKSFFCRPLGGAWTRIHTGVPVDAYQGYVLGSAGKAFCQQYGCQSTMRFNISKYTGLVARGLAEFWASMMEHLFCIWFEQPQWDFHFTDEHYNELPSAENLVNATEGLTLDHPVWDAITKIKASGPRKPAKVLVAHSLSSGAASSST